MNGSLDAAGEQAGARLRELRQARGWSLAEMARQVSYSKSYLSKLETGTKRITPDIARCLDEALDTGGALAAVVPPWTARHQHRTNHLAVRCAHTRDWRRLVLIRHGGFSVGNRSPRI
jgi:transcriptional regulator with XRE-family HTH domain